MIEKLTDLKNVYVKNCSNVQEKLKKFNKQGPDYIQILSDFDRTMSPSSDYDGNIICTSYAAFMHYSKKKDILLSREEELKAKFHKIEFSSVLTKDEKIPHMIQWWSESNKIILDADDHISSVEHAVSHSGIALRCGFENIISMSMAKNIPFIVVSAGLGDIVKTTVERVISPSPLIQYVSNFFVCDEQNKIVTFTKPMLHSYNKETITNFDIEFDEKRSNMIIIGDCIGDIHMSYNLKFVKNLLTIGFLNDLQLSNLEGYMDAFDVVIADPFSAEIAREILEQYIFN